MASGDHGRRVAFPQWEELPMSVVTRFAAIEDAPSIAELHARSWRATYRGAYRDEYLDGPLDDERLTVWTARLSDPPPNQLVVVAEENRQPVGFACAFGGHDRAWGSFLDNIHADPQRHREGIGTRLFTSVVDWCRECYPTHGLYLSVLDRNTNARRFYEKFGAIDRGGTPPSSEWVVEGVLILRYAWPTLDSVSIRSPSGRRSRLNT